MIKATKNRRAIVMLPAKRALSRAGEEQLSKLQSVNGAIEN
jgi:hypothetical protein